MRSPLPAAHCELIWTIDGGALRIADALSDLQVRDIGPDEVAHFDPDGRLPSNVNTPDDYERTRRAADGEPRSA